MPTTAAAQPGTGSQRPDRRTRHREQTRSEILDHALQIMAEDGAAGLTMARLARAMDIRPPSLYKYYPSLLAVYDALFRRGQLANLQALRDGMRDAEPGLDAVAGGMEATARLGRRQPGPGPAAVLAARTRKLQQSHSCPEAGDLPATLRNNPNRWMLSLMHHASKTSNRIHCNHSVGSVLDAFAPL